MSVEREEVFDPRRLVPVEWSVPAPPRVSVTLATKADACPRAAGLQLKYAGGAQTGPLLRGTLAHAFAERMMTHLMMHGEQSLFAAQADEDPVAAAAEVAQTTGEWVDELVEELGLPVCAADVDDVREMAYHLAVGNDVDPETVIAVERKFVLDTPDGTLSGKVDLASLPPDGTLQVDDYKSSFYVPPEDEFSRMFQTPLYGALILWGSVVDRERCGRCKGSGKEIAHDHYSATVEDAAAACERYQEPYRFRDCYICKGRGTVERIGEPLGLADHVEWVRCRQLYPRFLRCSACGAKMTRRGCESCGSLGQGRLAYREKLLGKADLRAAVQDARRAMRRIKRGVELREWPAVSGSHCNECPAEGECPLPSTLRRFPGAVSDPATASEAMEWAQRQGALVKATKAEVVAYVKSDESLEGELVVGAQTFSLQVSHPASLRRKGRHADWDGLQDAVVAASEEGVPFHVNDWLRRGMKTEFKAKRED